MTQRKRSGLTLERPRTLSGHWYELWPLVSSTHRPRSFPRISPACRHARCLSCPRPHTFERPVVPPAAAPPAAAGGLDFSSLLGLGGGAGASNPWAVPPPAASSSSATPSSSSSSTSPSSSTATGTAPAPAPAATPAPAPVTNPEETYAAQLTQMNDMGFTDTAACVRALVASQGNVNIAVERMLGGGV